MRRWLKHTLWVSAVLLALLAAALLVLPANFGKIVAAVLSDEFNGATVTVGKARFGFSGVTLHDVRIAPRGGQECFRAEHVAIRGRWSAILRGQIAELALTRPWVWLSVDAQGAWNMAALRGGGDGVLALDNVEIRDGEIALGQNPWGLERGESLLNVSGLSLRKDQRLCLEFDPQRFEARTQGMAWHKDALTTAAHGLRLRMQGEERVKLCFGTGTEPKFDLPLRVEAETLTLGAETLRDVWLEARLRRLTMEARGEATVRGQRAKGQIRYDAEKGKKWALRVFGVPLEAFNRWLPSAGKDLIHVDAELSLPQADGQPAATGAVSVASDGDFLVPDWGLRLRDWSLRAPFLLVAFPPKASATEILRAVSVRDLKLAATQFRLGQRMSARQFALTASLAEGNLTASIEAAAQPTGRFSARVNGPVWPTLDLGIAATLEQADLADVSEAYVPELIAGGEGTATVELSVAWPWDLAKGPTWSARGEVRVEDGSVRSGRLRVGEMRLVLPFTLASVGTTRIELKENAVARIGKIQFDGEEVARDVAIENLSGALPLGGAARLAEGAEVRADVQAAELRYGNERGAATARLALADGDAVIEALWLRGMGAEWEATGRVNIAGAPRVELDAAVKGLNLHRFGEEGKIQTFDVDGLLDGQARLRLSGRDWQSLEVEELSARLRGRGGGKVIFADNDWTRKLKQSQPLLQDLIFSKGNAVDYDQAEVRVGREGQTLVGEYSFQGKTVAPRFTLTYHGATWKSILKRLQQLSRAQIGAKP